MMMIGTLRWVNKYIGCSNLFYVSKDAHVVCRELGFAGAINLTSHSYFGPILTVLQESEGLVVDFKADEIKCNGAEPNLSKLIKKQANTFS